MMMMVMMLCRKYEDEDQVGYIHIHMNRT
jgi:hypothetical protein